MTNIINYINSHKRAKDILRANILFTFLTIIFNLCHFSLKGINLRIFIKTILLMNLCLVFKLLLDKIDHYLRQQKK